MAKKLLQTNLSNSVNLSKQIGFSAVKEVGAWYGPWKSIDDFYAAIDSLNIGSRTTVGVITVAIWDSGETSVTEYWNPDASLNFVKKTAEVSTDVPVDIDLSDYVSKVELEEKIGTPYVAAQGEEGEEGYVPAVDATGLRAEIEAVNEKSKKRFNTMLGIVEGVQIQQHNDLVEVQTNLDKNLEEAQQQQHDDLVEVHTNLQKNMDDAVARLEQNIKDVVGKHSVPAIGEDGSEEYVPAVEATGLLGEIEAVNEKSKKRFNTMLGIVQGVQEQQHADLVEVQNNLHGNIEEAQQQQHNDLVEVHTNLQKNMDDAVASLQEAIKGKANETHEHPSLASKDYVDEKVADLVGGAPETLNTLKEIGDALGAHEDEYGALLEVVGSKVSSTELAELIGTPREAAVGTEGEEGYKPLVPATGLHADIESVAYRRFMQMLGIVQGVQEQQHADLVEVQNNLHGNIEEAQQQQHDDLVEVHTNLQKNMDDAVARLEKNIEDTVAEAQEQQHADLEEVRINLENSIAQLESKEVVSAIDERVQSLESIDHSKFLTEHQDISNLASKEYVNAKVADLVNGAPETLDILKEISDAIANHKDEYDGLIDVVAQKASKAELAESLKDVVKLVDVSTETNPDRHSIILENHDLLIGKGANCEEGQPNGYEGGENLEKKSFNLAMVSKWNVADFGSSKIKMNLNSKDGKVFINDKEVVATVSDIAIAKTELSDKIAALVGTDSDTLETISRLSEAFETHSNEIEALAGTFETKDNVSAIDERVQSLESIDHSKFLTEHQDISSLAEKDYVDEAVKDAVKYTNISDAKNPNRSTIQLKGHDSLSGFGSNCEEGQPNGYEGGVDLSREAFNLAMVSKWNVADFGSPSIKANINAKDGKVFINDKEVVATEKYVDDAIAGIEIPSLNGYATEEWVESKNYLTEHQDISGKQDVIEDLATIREGAALGATALQEHQSLEGYVPKAMYDDLCEKFYKLLDKMQAYDDKFGYISIDGQVEWAKDVLFADEGDNEILFNIINGMGIAGNREALVAIMNDNDTNVAVLRDDIEIRETISLNDGKTKEIKLNGQSIKNGHIGETNVWTSNCDAVTVNDGNLTISGDGKIETLSRAGSPIYAHTSNATINIQDGFYLSNGLNPGKGWSLVYADGGAKINISGGYFAVVGKTDEKLYEYVLNCKDGSGSVITLTGGYFYEADPRKHDHPEEVVIAEGYTVEVLENAEFKGLTGTWYHVVEI